MRVAGLWFSMPETPDDLVELRTVVNELEAGMIESVLGEAGIPASHRTAKGIYLAMGMSSLNPSTVLVRRGDVERAEEVLSANRKDSVDIDWDEVDVGEPEDRVAAAGVAPVARSRTRKKAVRGIGLVVVFAVLLGPIVMAIVSLIVRQSPLHDHALLIGGVAGGLTAIVPIVTAHLSRRGVRHDADVFGKKE